MIERIGKGLFIVECLVGTFLLIALVTWFIIGLLNVFIPIDVEQQRIQTQLVIEIMRKLDLL